MLEIRIRIKEFANRNIKYLIFNSINPFPLTIIDFSNIMAVPSPPSESSDARNNKWNSNRITNTPMKLLFRLGFIFLLDHAHAQVCTQNVNNGADLISISNCVELNGDIMVTKEYNQKI